MAITDADDHLSFVLPVTGAILMFPVSAGDWDSGQDFRSLAVWKTVPVKAVQIVGFVGYDSWSLVAPPLHSPSPNRYTQQSGVISKSSGVLHIPDKQEEYGSCNSIELAMMDMHAFSGGTLPSVDTDFGALGPLCTGGRPCQSVDDYPT